MNKCKISGLSCPNCARTLEKNLSKIEGVENLKIDFVKGTLEYEGEKDLIKEIKRLTKKLESSAKIKEENDKKVDKFLIFDTICVIFGVFLGVFITFVQLPAPLYWTLYGITCLVLGYKTYYKAFVLLFKGTINENLLLTISVVGATILGAQGFGHRFEGMMVIGLYSIGKIFEGLATGKARRSIEKLAKVQPEYAVILINNKEKKVSLKEVKIGDTLVVRAGEKVAVDGKVIEGECFIDMQSLTGESAPVKVEKESEILSGSIVIDGVLKIEATSVYQDSAISKIMDLVEKASSNKSKTETFISKITKWYTLGVIVVSLLVFGINLLISKNFFTSFYSGLIILVISCPCAFAISVPLSYFAGLGNASKNGILIKGSNYLDNCAHLKSIAFDKTGTLTTGKFSLQKIVSFDKDYKEEDILKLASFGEAKSLHPLAKAVVSSYAGEIEEVENVREMAGKGVKFRYKNEDYFVGRLDKTLQNTAVELYKNDKKIGIIYLKDEIKENSKTAIQNLKNMGIKTYLLSGDNNVVVENVANEVGVDEFYSQLLPQDKYEKLCTIKKTSKVAYVGDGINDAPSLAVSDVGISMGINGSPATIEASDVVLVDDNIIKISKAIKISKHTRKIVVENILFSFVVKLVFLVLASFNLTTMALAVFADVGVTLLAILNSLRALSYKGEH